ncbi:MAG: T9SS type A sorting domain-containing protein [Porphyromonas sp.]|nr:T9SS type A sorting domain-containing protein [Porphyromonas sp.]
MKFSCKPIWGIVLFFLSVVAFQAKAQQSFGGSPKSFSPTNRTGLRSFVSEMPVREVHRQVSAAQLRAQAMQQVNAPAISGEVIEVSYNLARDGKRTLLSDGSVSYSMRIKGREAKGIYLFFSRFLITPGARLFMYNPDKSVVLGAYTSETNPSGGEFAIEPLPGDELILEYEAADANDLPQIEIDGVGYLYYRFSPHSISHKIGEDEVRTTCQVGANCSEGDGWDAQKRSVVQILIRIGNAISFCSGTLVNNTNEDFAPYILTAGHCAAYKEGDYDFKETDLNRWVFTFHYIKPSCSRSHIGSMEAKSMVGCRKVVYLPMHDYSDGMLLRLNQEIPESYRVYYSGWDRSENVPSAGVSLHHPLGDAMKISVFDKKPTIGKWSGHFVSAENAHFVTDFSSGETEGGSSGGAFFDKSSKLLVGTLTGGEDQRKCMQGSLSWYGRLSQHWNRFADKGNDKRMDIYLDPKGNGSAQSLQGKFRPNAQYLYPVTRVEALQAKNDPHLVQVTWKAPLNLTSEQEASLYYDLRRGEVVVERIKHVSGQTDYAYTDKLTPEQITSGKATYSVRTVLISEKRMDYTVWSEPIGVYLGNLPQTVPGKVTQKDGKQEISWTEPVLYQEWTRVPRDGKDASFAPIPMAEIKKHEVQIARQSLIKYAEKWPVGTLYYAKDKEEYSPAYITQICVLPRKAGEKFYINLDHGLGPIHRFVSYGEDSSKRLKDFTRRVEVTVPADWQKGQWITIPLQEPLKVSSEYMLRVGFETGNTANPASMFYQKLPEVSTRHLFVGPLVMIMVNSREEWYRVHFMSEVHHMLPEYWQGNMAFRLVVSNSATPLTKPLEQNVTSFSSALPLLPRPTQYSIECNGTSIATVNSSKGQTSYTYTLPNSSEEATYTIRPLYKGIQQVEQPQERRRVKIKITTEGAGKAVLYGYPQDTKEVYTNSVIWVDGYPNDSEHELASIVVNGKAIPDSEIWVQDQDLDIKVSFQKKSSVNKVAQEDKLTLYPNPAHYETTLSGLAAGNTVAIYSMDGILMGKYTGNLDGTLCIPLNHYTPGVYIVQTDKQQSVKLVVE